MTRPKAFLWAALGAAAVILVAVPAVIWLSAPTTLKATIEEKLSARLGLSVTIESLSLSWRPHLALSGTRLVVRAPPGLEGEPPFLSIDEFRVAIGPFSILRRHASTVHVGGLKVFVPPGGMAAPAGTGGEGSILIDHLEAHDAELTILQTRPDREPMLFKIQDLRVDDIGFGRRMPFRVEMTNYLPEGEVRASGSIGPWPQGDPASLPLTGDYTFTLANLADIKGIGGLLTSIGRFDGHLTEIAVEGTTDTPDFNLEVGGRPVPLSTTFKATVNASDGSVRLDQIDARLMNTPIHVTGTVENLPGPGRHQVTLNAEINGGHIEDVLMLATDSRRPFVTGNVRLTSAISLPPGKGKVRDRLKLTGRFNLDRGEFTDDAIEAKVSELSRRSRGPAREGAPDPARVFTRMAGTFRLNAGQLRLSGLTFSVPGAVVRLEGEYGLASSEINMTGTLRMDATVSQAVGGFKSIFLKLFDPLFRKDGAGAVVPIQITGTRAAPKASIRFGKVFSSDK